MSTLELAIVVAVVVAIWAITSWSSRPVHRPIIVEPAPSEGDILRAALASVTASEAGMAARLAALELNVAELRAENSDLKREMTRAKWTANAPHPSSSTEPYDRTLGNEHNLNNWD